MNEFNLERAQAWLRIAGNDLETAEAVFSSLPDISAFHFQQAAEKMLKAILQLHG